MNADDVEHARGRGVYRLDVHGHKIPIPSGTEWTATGLPSDGGEAGDVCLILEHAAGGVMYLSLSFGAREFLPMMMLRVVGAIILAVSVVGCSSSPPSVSAVDAAAASPRASAGAYALGPNDQLRVQVYNEPTISGDYTIDGAGFLAIPVAGRVRAMGLTPAQLERRIAAKLNNGMLKDARVTVQVSGYAPFYIRGEVKKPGEFPYRPGLTLGDAVALAGGYTYRADESKAYIRAAGAGVEVTRPLDVDPPIAPGDNIRIPERFF